jgi:hypothetical protein
MGTAAPKAMEKRVESTAGMENETFIAMSKVIS